MAFKWVEQLLKISENIEYSCSTATWNELWFVLSENVQNFDMIHIFSHEKYEIPPSVIKLLSEKGEMNSINIHIVGNTFEGYISTVSDVMIYFQNCKYIIKFIYYLNKTFFDLVINWFFTTNSNSKIFCCWSIRIDLVQRLTSLQIN